jgi:hypothetical protein
MCGLNFENSCFSHGRGLLTRQKTFWLIYVRTTERKKNIV